MDGVITKFSTAEMFDAAESLGISPRCFPYDVRPICETMRFCGPVYTIRGISSPEVDDSFDELRIQILSTFPAGSVAVFDCQGDRSAAHFGEMMALTLRSRGCIGAVIAGFARDTQRLVQMEFPTFCKGRIPVDGRGRFRLVAADIPILLHGQQGDIPVLPGDWIVGDADGVIVIPGDDINAVAEAAAKIADREDQYRRCIASGKHFLPSLRQLSKF